jgi:hypothetical protein
MKKLIYLASPYSAPTEAERMVNFQTICEWSARIMTERRVLVLSPIAHSHPIAIAGSIGGAWEDWQALDLRLISACDEIWVACMPGWFRSRGIQAELKYAESVLIPIKFVTIDAANIMHVRSKRP